ncbi:NAD kinase 2, mitochondrial isoform X2 [Onthophagus taurus]|uniref:NAD kinase 2, mitochondrial isoform X2 n=1 Tax=Onthophagus taurus TaxID=166361 RepID=UPI000C204F88|nr:NAD kinase 2, mitochondrial [Onthophagus taurus]
MYKPKYLFKNVISGRNSTYSYSNTSNLKDYGNALIVSKLSGYEFERHRNSDMTPDDLRQKLIRRGTDFDRLIKSHDNHKKYESDMVQSLEKSGFKVKVVNSLNYNDDSVNWADIVFPTGGDGTFLLAAGRVRTNSMPVIGFNSSPARSEGRLCLPKSYSYNIEKAIEKLRAGQFEWLRRSRIRVTITGETQDIVSTPLYVLRDQVSFKPSQYRIEKGSKLIPHLALNEVFIGETLSARVSNLELWLDKSNESTTIKCSGLCISTGTGSTSWHLSMNRLPAQTVETLLTLLHYPEPERTEKARQLCKMYNDALIFNATETRLAYTIRENICLGVWPQGRDIKRRGFVDTMKVKSKCFDAALVVDGGISYEFNDGTIAELSVLPEDALLTVKIFE